ncbi:MAG TPA: ABC transporter permease [Terracidiphilus sp.]|nr:ABC transporter permease [Terracidiphilus sp.]
MNTMLRDLQYTLRQFRRAPGFAITAMLTLALSVGIATAVFCVLDAVVLRPLPYPQPDRIVDFDTHNSAGGYYQPASWPSYLDERKQATSFKELAGYFRWIQSAAETPTGPAVLDVVRTSDNFFDVFGVQPMLGREFLPGEEQTGKNDIVVLGYDAWMKHFNGSRNVVGSAVKIDGRTFTIVGVMPAGFRFPLNTHDGIYIPVHLNAAQWMTSRGGHWLRTVARLKDGVTIAQAQADMLHIFGNLAKAYPDTDGGRTVRLQPISQAVDQKGRGPLWVLLGAVLAVLAIGCVNIAGLLLSRGVKREREMAMRVAIGADRRRLLRQMFTEGLLLGVAGAAGGVLLAWSSLDLMRAFLIKALQRGADVHLNWTVLGAALGIAIVASLAASLVPAIKLSGVDPNRALRAGGSAGTGRGEHRLRAGFIVTQVALTLVLLVVATLLMRVVTRYHHVDLGYDPNKILAIDLHVAPVRYDGHDVLADFYKPLLDRVSRIPGVRAAGLIDMLPIESWGSNRDAHISGQPPYPRNEERLVETRMVSNGYFDVFGISNRAGRPLSPVLDGPANKAATVVVNQAFVNEFLYGRYPAAIPRLDDSDKPDEKTQVVGVTGDVRQDLREHPLAEMDTLLDEVPVNQRASAFSSMVLVVRADGDPHNLIEPLRQSLHEVDPTVPLSYLRTMTDVINDELIFDRMVGWLFGIFASMALVLALVGLYGLVSHEVELGRRDIGVRMALGATRHSVLAMVLRRVVWMLGAGTAAGILLALAARKLIGVVIYFDAGKEYLSLFIIALLLVVAGLLAALIPAGRAASTDPMQALRAE